MTEEQGNEQRFPGGHGGTGGEGAFPAGNQPEQRQTGGRTWHSACPGHSIRGGTERGQVEPDRSVPKSEDGASESVCSGMCQFVFKEKPILSVGERATG